MKDIFNRRQRFSLRKYSFGVASVLLGTALFAAHTAQAEEVDAASTSSSDSSAAVGAEGTADLVKETATSVAQSDPTAAAAAEAPTSTLPISVAAASETPKAEATTSEAAKEEASSSAKSEAAKPAENKATSEAAKPATPASTAAASGKVETTASTTAATATPAAAAANHSAATAAPVAEETPAAETAAAATSVKPNVTARGYSRFYSVGSAADRSATLDRAATDLTNAGALASGRSRRTRRSATDPVSTNYTEGSAAATPTMSDANGAYVTNRPLTIPTPKDPGNAVTPGVNFQFNPNASQYTFAITDLHKFNEAYNTKYYYRLSKPYDNSTNVTLELVDGRNNSVVETKNISGAGTVTLGQSVLSPISGNSRAYIEFRFENIQDADKTNRPALRATWIYQGSVNDFNIPRSALQIYDAYEPANEGTTITDPQYYIPRQTTKTTYYKIVDTNSSTYNDKRLVGKFVKSSNGKYVMNSSTAGDFKLVNGSGTPEVNTQSYKETGHEESLGSFTITAMEGQNIHASALRAFDGYNLYQTADPDSLLDILKKPYTVGQRWFDVANAQGGVKRIKEVVKEDGTVRIEMWAIKSDSLNKITKDLSTDGYVKVYETVIKPGSNNFKDHPEDLGTHPKIDDPEWNKGDIPFTIQPNDGKNSPGEFFSKGAKTTTGAFEINGVPVSSGNLFRLENTLKPSKPTVYYYVKKAPVTVIPEVEKQLEGRKLVNGEFSFKIKEKQADQSLPSYEETVTNTDGKATFSKLTFDKVGTYTYTITETAGSDTNVDYDAMEVTMTVKVTENATGDLQASVKYTDTDDLDGNDHVVVPVKTKFDFSKALAGRADHTLKAGEFSFQLKDSTGTVVETVKNDAAGNVSFSNLSFDNTKVGTHEYTVEEVRGSEAGMQYDPMKANVTINVTKDAKTGLLKARVEKLADTTEFNNYVVAPVKTKFNFSKALAGRALKDGEFTFQLKDANGTVLQTKTNNASGVIAFDDLTFTNAQVGTHKYTVEEVRGSEAGMQYDPMKAEVTITVTKDGHVLKAVNTLPADTEFNNTFTPAATQAQFRFTKRLEGKTLEANAFTFELLENGNVIQTKQNAADGSIQFDLISYATVGTHTYTVREKAGTDTNIDYDSMNAVVTVNVTKDAQTGLLNAAVTMPADTEFNNFAVAPVKTRFDFSKALAGRALKDGEFSFVLKDANGTVLQTKTNNASGVIAFDDLTFTNAQVGTHKYTVEEVRGSEAGVQYDTMKAEVTITVTKDGHVLKAVNTLPADTEFNNTFTPAATQAQFRFTKRLEGKTLEANAFTFELLENGNVIQTKKNAADGSIQFDPISYATVGTHTYTVREVAGTDTNIDYDPMNAVVTVNVTKDAQTGLLNAAVTMPADTEFNNYVVAPVVTKFDFTKKLAGRELKAGEFSFVLKDAATGAVVETVKNDAAGNVSFSNLSFDNTKVGTHTYTVEEVIPANKEFGMTYDTMKATVTVTVAKNGHSLTTVTNVSSTGGKDANGNATDGTADKEFNNKVTPPETPKFQPEKFVVSKEKYDVTGRKLMDDDDELTDEYAETNANPYADGVANNEPENLNTKTVKRGSKLVYQVWLDTNQFTEANNVQYVGVSDTYDADKLTVNASDIKAYDSVTGADVTNKFDIKVENGTITATSKEEFIKDKVNNPVIDTTKFEFGRYYKFDIPATVKESVKAGADIENTANQTVHVYNPVSKTVETPHKPTQKRVNSVPVPLDLNFTKTLAGRTLQANEFEFILKKDGTEVERAHNDASGKVNFKTLEFGRDDLGKTYNYTVEEVRGTDSTVTYDPMVATVKVVVSHDGTAKAIVATVTDAVDKEFNNRVTPPTEPKFQPEKYVVSKAKFDITGTKLVDDDSELTDKYGETNTNPYVDNTNNNEAENLNTKSVERGSKLYYQVWLDTTKFDANNKENIQTVGISDDFDETKLNVTASDIKVYDSVTGADVTNKFDIAINNGIVTANLKAGFTKSLGDAENTQIIDTTKFEFGRYYKFDIPATVKNDVVAGADIENKAAQVVNYYNPVSKTVEKPNKPTEKRVNSVPISVEFNFTKKLEGRALKANEFTFELKDSDNVVIARTTNDADGNFKFSPVDYTNKAGETVTALKYKKGQEGTYTYTVTEVKGTDSTVTYDPMAAVVTVKVSHDGTAKALITNVTDPADKEFNNRVTPPTEPKFQPEKYVVSKAKFDITGTKLVDDDSELTDKYGETNANPYVDDTKNNEAENLNTKTVERGSKL
ncbi:FctA domain-containing protein, partial [uncultured Streptococcus sp.]|uniref:Spy0128 family protein n=1 Tax=uncultured Streptococcus sp. TaxID=83427 RepID=UPI002676FB4F